MVQTVLNRPSSIRHPELLACADEVRAFVRVIALWRKPEGNNCLIVHTTNFENTPELTLSACRLPGPNVVANTQLFDGN
jgi:hypothetical protein